MQVIENNSVIVIEPGKSTGHLRPYDPVVVYGAPIIHIPIDTHPYYPYGAALSHLVRLMGAWMGGYWEAVAGEARRLHQSQQ
jgi:hypothetical protein